MSQLSENLEAAIMQIEAKEKKLRYRKLQLEEQLRLKKTNAQRTVCSDVQLSTTSDVKFTITEEDTDYERCLTEYMAQTCQLGVDVPCLRAVFDICYRKRDCDGLNSAEVISELGEVALARWEQVGSMWRFKLSDARVTAMNILITGDNG